MAPLFSNDPVPSHADLQTYKLQPQNTYNSKEGTVGRGRNKPTLTTQQQEFVAQLVLLPPREDLTVLISHLQRVAIVDSEE